MGTICRLVMSEILVLSRKTLDGRCHCSGKGDWGGAAFSVVPPMTTRWHSCPGHLFLNTHVTRPFLHPPCRATPAEGPADPPPPGREGDDFPRHDRVQHPLAGGLLPNAQLSDPLPLQHRGGSQRRTFNEKCNK